jgi:xanthine dehydrogenase/oxidase
LTNSIVTKGNLCRCTGYRPILEGFKSFTADGWAKTTCVEAPKAEGCCGASKNGGCCQQQNSTEENDEQGTTAIFVSKLLF